MSISTINAHLIPTEPDWNLYASYQELENQYNELLLKYNITICGSELLSENEELEWQERLFTSAILVEQTRIQCLQDVEGKIALIKAQLTEASLEAPFSPDLGEEGGEDDPQLPPRLNNGRRSVTKTCSMCYKEKSSTRWYKNPADGTSSRCHACYNKAKDAVTKTCSICHKEKTANQWYTDPADGTTSRCNACYNKAKDAVTKTCSICHKEKPAKRWYKNLADGTISSCDACYRKTYRQQKKRVAPEEGNVADSNKRPRHKKELLVGQEALMGQEEALADHAVQGSEGEEAETPIKKEPIEDDLDFLGSKYSLVHPGINNALPILQHPDDPNRSILLESEGPIEEITVSCWGVGLPSLLQKLPGARRIAVKEKIIKGMQDWLQLNENDREGYTKKLEDLVKVITPIDLGPDRGSGTYTKRRFEQFEVIAPYAGALHNEKSLEQSIRSHGSYNILTYLFGTRSSKRTIDGFGRGNITSLVNTGALPNLPAWSENNLAVVLFGKNINFYVALRDIQEGEELLVDYGPDYNPMQRIKTEAVDEEDTDLPS